MEHPPLYYWISLLVGISACITIAAHSRHLPRLWVYLFKPLTTTLILALALLPRTFLTDLYAGSIALGLLFSLAGDIFLMLPNHFLPGLVSFLVAHLCYWVAFFPGAGRVETLGPFFLLGIFGAGLLRALWPGLPVELKGPVSLYVLVIVGMAALAVSRALHLPAAASYAAAAGAMLFLTSDTLLALARFRKPFPLAEAAVLSTYFAGQLLIALSIGLGIT